MSAQPVGKPEVFDIRDARCREWASGLKPLRVVSGDSHAMATPEDYVYKYMDPKYREHADGYLRNIREFHDLFSLLGYPFSAEYIETIDARGAMRAGGELGGTDPHRRLREMEAEGVAAEILHPDGPLVTVPFFSYVADPSPPELRAAGYRSHNRFITEFCSVAPKRLLGVHLIYPWPDMQAAVRDCEKAAEVGAKAIYPPMQAGVEGDDPPFYDPFYDPLWAACEELGLAVHIHAGWGGAQGSLPELSRIANEAVANSDFSALAEVLDTFIERRPLWQFMWGGAFDRFPDLKLVLAEVHCDWLPGTLAFLEKCADKTPGLMKLRPTEYWERNCAVANSVARYGDLAASHEIGIDRFLFGVDYPHVESTWPNTRDWAREMLRGFNETDARKILGENAIRFYNLDESVIDEVANRVGPLPTEVLGSHEVDPVIVEHFANTQGTRKSLNLHQARMEELVAKDIAGAIQMNS